MSAAEFVAFFNKKHYHALEECLQRTSDEVLSKILDEIFSSSLNKNALMVVKAILSGELKLNTGLMS